MTHDKYGETVAVGDTIIYWTRKHSNSDGHRATVKEILPNGNLKVEVQAEDSRCLGHRSSRIATLHAGNFIIACHI